MPLSATGALSFSAIQAEHGGTHPISLSEYYRGAGFVKANSSDVPTSGAISVDDLRGTALGRELFIEVIGGGGGGGSGTGNHDGGNTTPGGTGYASSVSLTGTFTLTSAGATGGASRYQFKVSGTAGASSYYGPGGAGGIMQSSPSSITVGQHAPSDSYGAGGGGGSADRRGGGNDDESGHNGAGGNAASRETTNQVIGAGSTIDILIGKGGAGADDFNDGGDGGAGYAKITIGNSVTEFTYSGSANQQSHTFTVPSS